jgi:hypothetical protein
LSAFEHRSAGRPKNAAADSRDQRYTPTAIEDVTVYKDSIRFDSIVVIESLREGALETGKQLFDRVIHPWAVRNAPFYVRFARVHTRSEFFDVLDGLRDELFRLGHKPIVHIEAHGDRDGLELGSGEHVRWEELRDRLTVMNGYSQLNLLLVMAMCAGWHLSTLLTPMQRAPVWGVVGPLADVVNAGDLRDTMETFYAFLLNTFDARGALEAANSNFDSSHWTYVLETAEVMLCRVFNSYVNEQSTDIKLKEREDEIVAEIVRKQGCDLTVAFDARQMARTQLADHQTTFDLYRKQFLWIDEFPDNNHRFKLTLSDCVNLPQPGA